MCITYERLHFVPMTGPCQLASEIFFCFLVPLTLSFSLLVCLFLLSVVLSVSSRRPFSPILFPCRAIISPVFLVTFQSLSLLFSCCPYLFTFLCLLLRSFLLWVSLPRFRAPCNIAQMQLLIRWLFPFPCHLVVCFSTSIACSGPSLLLFSFTFASFSSMFLRFRNGVPLICSLLFALQISLSQSLLFFISFQCSSPLLIPSSSSIHLLVLFLLHDVSFCFLKLPRLSGICHGHKMGSACKPHYIHI